VTDLGGCEDGGPAKSSGDEVVLWFAASGEVWNSGPRQVVGAANGLLEAVELDVAVGNLC